MAAVCGVLLTGSAMGVDAQQWSWPDEPQNLQELPADFPPERLSAVMRGFTNALGVRCSYCHVGVEGEPLSSYDFASDANPNKDRARAMYRLLGAVNEHLAEIEPSGSPVNMWCHTCHQGKPRPQTLAEALDERRMADGGEAALALFRQLRERYYGAGAYDLTAGNVASVATAFVQEGDTATAMRMLEWNAEDYPESATAHEALGDLLLVTGARAAARAAYTRALELLPGNTRLQRKLADVGGREPGWDGLPSPR